MDNIKNPESPKFNILPLWGMVFSAILMFAKVIGLYEINWIQVFIPLYINWGINIVSILVWLVITFINHYKLNKY